MLISFTAENAYSFKDEQTLDMRATTVKAHNYSLLKAGTKKLLPVTAVYGANASGKSNLLRALEVVFSLIAGSEMVIPVSPFAMGHTAEGVGPSRLTLHFFIDIDGQRSECFYHLFFASRCIGEALTCVFPGKRKASSIFMRGWNNETEKWEIQSDIKSTHKDIYTEVYYVHEMETKREALLLKALGKRARFPLFEHIQKWAEKVVLYHEVNLRFISPIIKESDELVPILESDGRREELVSFIHMLNPLIRDISVLRDSDWVRRSKEKHVQLYFDYDSAGGQDTGRNTMISAFESRGVWTALRLYPRIDDVLRNGGLLIVDELENSLHPLLMAKIINMFTDPDVNTGRGQLIFTTHNALLMDKKYFRQDEIAFVEKDPEDGSSSLYRLSDVEGVRSDLDFCKNYILGAFGALPDLSGGPKGAAK